MGAAQDVRLPRLSPDAAGIPPLQLSRFMGHAKVTTTLAIYTHLFDDDHAETMAALDALAAAPTYGGNVISLHG